MWEYVKVVTGAQYKHYFHVGQNINVTCGTEYKHTLFSKYGVGVQHARDAKTCWWRSTVNQDLLTERLSI